MMNGIKQQIESIEGYVARLRYLKGDSSYDEYDILMDIALEDIEKILDKLESELTGKLNKLEREMIKAQGLSQAT